MVRRALGFFLFFMGLLLISQGLIQLAKRQGIYSETHLAPKPSRLSEEPMAIELPSIKISLPVFTTEIVNQTWPTSENGVSYIKDSGKLGVSGNLIMYGHNWKPLLGNLKSTKVGDILSITSNQNNKYTFKVKYVATVDSKDVSILADTSAERVTLYTCTGLLDSKRFVVVAEAI